MRIVFAVIAALLVGAVLGAAATHELHAQSKPPVRYVVTEIAVRNIPGYVNESAPRAQESIKKAGGKILAASLTSRSSRAPLLHASLFRSGTAPSK